MNKIMSQLRLAGLDLSIGSSSREHRCPFCNGGGGCFNLTRVDEGLVYNCFRATCGAHGFVPSNAMIYQDTKPKKEREPNPFREGTFSVLSNKKIQDFLFNTYGLEPNELENNQVMVSYESDRLAIPIFAFPSTMHRIGTWTKKLPWSKYAGPKSVLYWNEAPESLYEPWCQVSSTDVVVVEDPLSAIKLSKITESVALMGTHMTEDVAKKLSEKFSGVSIALDPDATQKAISIKHKYGLLFKSFNVFQMDADPKDTPYTELRRIFGEQ